MKKEETVGELVVSDRSRKGIDEVHSKQILDYLLTNTELKGTSSDIYMSH